MKVRKDNIIETQPITATSLPLPTNASTESTLSALEGKVPSGLTVAGSRLQVELPTTTITGTLDVNNFPATQVISAVSLPLPTGAATSANQTTEIASLGHLTDNTQTTQIVDSGGIAVTIKDIGTQVISTDIGLVVNSVIHGKTTAGGGGYIDVKVNPSGALTADVTQSGTWNISNVSGTISLPTGAATAALQTQPGVDIGDVTINNSSGASAVNIQDGGNSITVDGEVSISSSTTAMLTSVSSSATSVTLLASNASRKMMSVFNESTKILYLKFGTTASLTDYTVQIAAGAYYEMPVPAYTGRIDGIWDSANGTARITEY